MRQPHEIELTKIKYDEPIGLIFDVDELLFDNQNEILAAYAALLKNRSIEPAGDERYPGRDLFEIIANLKDKYHLAESVEELVRERREVYLGNLRASRSGPCAGVREVFHFLEANRGKINVRVAYTTSSERAFTEIVMKKIFSHIGLGRYASDPEAFFYHDAGRPASTCWQAGLKKKPDPMLYELTIGKLKLPPAQCLAFEDSLSGFQAAYQAGANIFVVPRPRGRAEFDHLEFNQVYEGRVCKLAVINDVLPFMNKVFSRKGGDNEQR